MSQTPTSTPHDDPETFIRYEEEVARLAVAAVVEARRKGRKPSDIAVERLGERTTPYLREEALMLVAIAHALRRGLDFQTWESGFHPSQVQNSEQLCRFVAWHAIAAAVQAQVQVLLTVDQSPKREEAPPQPQALPDAQQTADETPSRIVSGLRLVVHQEGTEYGTERAGRDYHLRLEEGEWVVDVFDSAIQGHNEAHIRTFSEETLEMAVTAILEDHAWPPCPTCGSTLGPGPEPEEPCVTCSLGAPCCGGRIEVAGPLYGKTGMATRCAECSTVFTEPHPTEAPSTLGPSASETNPYGVPVPAQLRARTEEALQRLARDWGMEADLVWQQPEMGALATLSVDGILPQALNDWHDTPQGFVRFVRFLNAMRRLSDKLHVHHSLMGRSTISFFGGLNEARARHLARTRPRSRGAAPAEGHTPGSAERNVEESDPGLKGTDEVSSTPCACQDPAPYMREGDRDICAKCGRPIHPDWPAAGRNPGAPEPQPAQGTQQAPGKE